MLQIKKDEIIHSLHKKKVIICGIVRNAEDGLRHNIPTINMLCNFFDFYNVIIFENDSTDRTKELLNSWHNQFPDNIHIISETNPEIPPAPIKDIDSSNPFFGTKRIWKMVLLRNKYFEYIDKKKITGNYLIVVDLDVVRIDLDGILSSFARDDWDAVSAFGYSYGPKLKRRYHDTYALTFHEAEIQTERQIIDYQYQLSNISSSNEWIPVFSAFGGLTIYRFDAISGLRYQLIPNKDNRVTTRCEHYSLHVQMKKRGYDRFFINPSMLIYYQKITFNVICHYISNAYNTLRKK